VVNYHWLVFHGLAQFQRGEQPNPIPEGERRKHALLFLGKGTDPGYVKRVVVSYSRRAAYLWSSTATSRRFQFCTGCLRLREGLLQDSQVPSHVALLLELHAVWQCFANLQDMFINQTLFTVREGQYTDLDSIMSGPWVQIWISTSSSNPYKRNIAGTAYNYLSTSSSRHSTYVPSGQHSPLQIRNRVQRRPPSRRITTRKLPPSRMQNPRTAHQHPPHRPRDRRPVRP
jgi:hypothetical protein